MILKRGENMMLTVTFKDGEEKSFDGHLLKLKDVRIAIDEFISGYSRILIRLTSGIVAINSEDIRMITIKEGE